MTIQLSHLEEVKKIYTKLNMFTPEEVDMERIATAFQIWIHYEKKAAACFV